MRQRVVISFDTLPPGINTLRWTHSIYCLSMFEGRELKEGHHIAVIFLLVNLDDDISCVFINTNECL